MATLTAEALKILLTAQLPDLVKEKEEWEAKLYSDDYSGDWGEGNEDLGYYTGQIELIQSILKLI